MVPSVERVREVRAGLLAAGSVVDRVAGGSHALFPVAIGREEGSALGHWVRREGAVAALEIGLGYGIATLFICEALLQNDAGGRHVAIDPHQFAAGPEHRTRFAGTGLDVLEEAGIRPLVEFHEEESQVVLPRLLSDRRRFDFAFIDGSHRFDAVFLDLVYCVRLLHAGSVVFVDDAQLAPVRKAIDYCTSNLDCVVDDGGAEGPSHAWRVLRTPGPDAFPASVHRVRRLLRAPHQNGRATTQAPTKLRIAVATHDQRQRPPLMEGPSAGVLLQRAGQAGTEQVIGRTENRARGRRGRQHRPDALPSGVPDPSWRRRRLARLA
jgi:predicted O-methyltransferase YrrM